jgi:hypothetical protein
MLSSEQLELFVACVRRDQEADGALLLIASPGGATGFEYVAAVKDSLNIPKVLRALADEIESGGGIPMGRHMEVVKGVEG